jgi:hypothetical protein
MTADRAVTAVIVAPVAIAKVAATTVRHLSLRRPS